MYRLMYLTLHSFQYRRVYISQCLIPYHVVARLLDNENLFLVLRNLRQNHPRLRITLSHAHPLSVQVLTYQIIPFHPYQHAFLYGFHLLPYEQRYGQEMPLTSYVLTYRIDCDFLLTRRITSQRQLLLLQFSLVEFQAYSLSVLQTVIILQAQIRKESL